MISSSRWRQAIAGARDWWLDPEERHEENSNSLAIVILLLPIILGAFGLGFDVARNMYVRTNLQGAMDMALASAAAVTTPDPVNPGKLIIDRNNAPTVLYEVYNKNRTANAGLKCIGTYHCWAETNAIPGPTFNTNGTSISYSVREETSNMFLNVLGLPTQSYVVEGTAEITSRNE